MLRLLVLMSFFTGFALADSQAPSPQILDYYPACDYEVIDTITLKQRLGSKFQDPGMNELQEATQILLDKIRSQASEVGVDSIAIVDKEIFNHVKSNDSSMRGYVELTAELFNHCAEQNSLTRKNTPFDANADRQIELEKSTLSIESKIEVVVNIGNNKPNRPELPPLELTSGNRFYDLRIGASFNDVVDKLGTPTSEFILGEGQKTISYGRRLWLVFEEQSLVYVTNHNHWLSNELLNMFEFDERIAGQDWIVHDEFKMGMVLTEEKLSSLGEKMASDRILLSSTGENESVYLLFETEQHKNTNQPIHKITGFGFGTGNKRFWSYGIKQSPDNTDAYQSLAALIKDKSATYQPIQQQDIESSPMLIAHNQDRGKLLVINNHLVLELDNNSLSNLHLIESVHSKANRTQSSGWEFAGVRQGQSKEAVKNHFGDKVFDMG